MADWKNQLYFGDNLEVLRKHIPDESVDLIYLDPPWNSNASYNVIFAEASGEASPAQIQAFEDTWHWSQEAEAAYHEMVTAGPQRLGRLLEALRRFLGQNDMMAYLVMMAPRLVELHRVLKPTGSLYLHCDPTASHYIKLLLDAVFGHEHLRNEIIWQRSAPRGHAFTRFPSTHDVLFFYCKGTSYTWHTQYLPHREEYIKSHYAHIEPETGRRYMLDNCLNPNPNRPNLTYEWNGHVRVWRWTREKMQQLHDQGRLVYTRSGIPRYKRYLDEMPGTPVTSVWTDIAPVNSQAKERLGYPTQKPEALLERIVRASTDEGDLVLDPFCGCGTAVVVAERLKRRWIGVDITYLAINLIRRRLEDTFGSELSPYEVKGIPVDVPSAVALAQQNRHQFEWWAVDLADGRPAHDHKKGADKGIDGYIRFFDDDSGQAKTLVIQVKSGRASVKDVRDLKGVMDREKAPIGALITLEEPTRAMVEEAAAAGFYVPEHPSLQSMRYPRLQILTVEQLLAGQRLLYPRMIGVVTYRQAARRPKSQATQERLEGISLAAESRPRAYRVRRRARRPEAADDDVPTTEG